MDLEYVLILPNVATLNNIPFLLSSLSCDLNWTIEDTVPILLCSGLDSGLRL